MSVPDSMTVHPIVVDTFHSKTTNFNLIKTLALIFSADAFHINVEVFSFLFFINIVATFFV